MASKDGTLERQYNAMRFAPVSSTGHVESWFWRANHPTRPLAVWLKATVFAPRAGSAVAEVWAVVFDGERGKTLAARRAVPWGQASFGAEELALGGAEFVVGGAGALHGELPVEGGALGWELRVAAVEGPLGAPMSLLPHEALIDAGFPRNKLLTPHPVLRFDGELRTPLGRVEVDGWTGMQGHNWGASHAWEYAWGQCHFLDEAWAVHCVVEGFSGKLRMAGRVTPWLSALVVRRGGREYRFDRLVDLWRQSAHVGDTAWRLHMFGGDGEAVLELEARPEMMVCLGYHNPDGRLSYCLNSKLASARLRVNPFNESGFECVSAHGAALELLRNQHDDRFGEVV